MREPVTVACAQVEPVVLDRDATIEKLAATAAEASAEGARVVVFPEAVVPAYPSSVWAKALAGWADDGAKQAFALLAREAVEVPGPAERRLGEIAREHELWLVTGVTERDPRRGGTLYNTLLYHGPDGELALTHRKLVPTNHERLVWGQGDGRGLVTVPTPLGQVGGLICWENFMPLARFALYERGVEIYLAPTAEDSEAWLDSMRHIARESRAFVLSCCVFQRASSYPADVPLADGDELIGRGGSAIVAPDGTYLAGPLWDEEGILFADLDPDVLYRARQRFDPAGHYHRPDVLQLTVKSGA
jgi:nitrilase